MGFETMLDCAAFIISISSLTSHMILLRRDLCFYNQTNEHNLKITLLVRFSSWFLYIWIEQIVQIIVMFISGSKE